MSPSIHHLGTSFITDFDIYLLNEGRHLQLYNKLGTHLHTLADGRQGVHFAVWAPNAQFVSVMGDFNNWNKTNCPLENIQGSGFWGGFIEGIGEGASYKYTIQSGATFHEVEKADPVGFFAELRPNTASRVWNQDNYQWQDQEWMAYRSAMNGKDKPISMYEVHLGSWMKNLEEGGRWLTYRELADKLVSYVKEMGYTHVELMPIAEHPFDLSWGYQTVGYFAPTSRFGNPDEFKYLVDQFHLHGIGVIIDWVPAHFPKDMHGLDFFDGTHLYEHDDWRKREHKDWGTNIFNYGRWEVRNFLMSNALFWLDKYHIDGLRVDAVASMLYLDYSRKKGEWEPNQYGGRENIDAIYFLRDLNDSIHHYFPDCITFAEESTAWGGVTKPTFEGGLGFDYKWDMGWMHDTLHYLSHDPIHRKYHQNEITFRGLYMFSESYTLPLSHDEVVHGKQSLLGKLPGDLWQKFANLRTLLAYQWAQPGKKLMFMGGDIAQWNEWNCLSSVDWHLLEHDSHAGMKRLMQALNHLYRTQPAMHQKDCDSSGYYLIDCTDADNSVLSFMRRGYTPDDDVIVVANFTPQTHVDYMVGVPQLGDYVELLNTDDTQFGGSGQTNHQPLTAFEMHYQGQPSAVRLTLPPLGVVFLKRQSR
ncbi:MAG: 1,4-alpha-glucan branching protein GlgB [Vampirovibrionales bacterium]